MSGGGCGCAGSGCGCGGPSAEQAHQRPATQDASPAQGAVPERGAFGPASRTSPLWLLPYGMGTLPVGAGVPELARLLATLRAHPPAAATTLVPGPEALKPSAAAFGISGGTPTPLELAIDDLRVHWGTVDREIPLSWWIDYEGNQRHTKVSSFLEIMWSDVKHAMRAHGVDWDELDEHIGCFNIDADLARNDVYDKLFFRDTGGARQYLKYTMALIASYHAYAEESFSGTEYCEGFPEFLGKLFKGKSATNRLGDTCFLRVHVRSQDGRFDDKRVATCAPGYETADPCGARTGPGINSGPFDTWEPHWLSAGTGGDVYPYLYVKDGGEVMGTPTVEGESGGAEGDRDGFSIFIHANRLAFAGYELDLALYFSRLLWDYGSETGDLGYLHDGHVLGRWALLGLVDKGRLLIHEAGHVWTGGGHCKWGFCFEMGAQAWVCELTALLGLPGTSLYPSDVPPAAFRLGTAGTDDGAEVNCAFNYGCLISDPGVQGSGAGFYAARASQVPSP